MSSEVKGNNCWQCKIFTRDVVYFKCNGCDHWKGTVIGHVGQQALVKTAQHMCK